MSNPDATCQNCAGRLPADAAGPICPACLVREALESVDTLAAEVATELPADGETDSPSESDPLEGSALGLGGRYKILQRIGEGGFGVVYMAEQNIPVRRRVAVKILKAGMDTRQLLARFEAERQALAMMDHPNIAKVHDGGETEQGRPFFVMELVRGTPITEFCNREKLSPKARLKLFIQVCGAVQHAHQKGIIHRDLKPSNILITMPDGAEPVPKVIDFGVAKAMENNLTDKTLFTRFEQMIGTPAYMSPEQAGAEGTHDIDTRADIYALGVLLYELLAGTTPFEPKKLQSAAFDEVRRILREDEAPRPSVRLSSLAMERRTTIAKDRATEASTLGKHLRGDLDWIVMKAIEKDRRRRYDTANALAADVERHLANEPVTAGPPTVTYRFSKFLRRNKAGVGVAAAILISLIGGLTLSAIGFARAKEEAAKARDAKETAANESSIARAINEFLVDDIIGQAGADEGLEPDLTMRTALDRAAARADERLQGQPLVLAYIHEVLRDAYDRMGLGQTALAEARKAYGILSAELGEDSPRTLYARYQVGHMLLSHLDRDQWEEALEHLEPVLEKQRETLGESHPETLWSLHKYLFAAAIHRPEVDVIALARSFVARTEAVHPSEPMKKFEAYRTLAWVLDSKDSGAHGDEIVSLVRRSLKGVVETAGENDPLAHNLRTFLSSYLEGEGRYEEAATAYQDLIASIEANDGTNSIKLIPYSILLGVALGRMGNHEEAGLALERSARITLAQSEELDGDYFTMIVDSIAAKLQGLGRNAEAHSLLLQASSKILENSERGLGDRARQVLNRLAVSHRNLGALQEAKKISYQAIGQIIQDDGFFGAAEEDVVITYLQVCHELGEDIEEKVRELEALSPDPVPQKDVDTLRAKWAMHAGNRAAESSDWEQALTHFEAALTDGQASDNPVDVLRYGTVLFRLGDDQARRRACETFMNRFEFESRSVGAASAAKALFLAPCKVDDPLFQRALHISRKLTGDSYKGELYPWFCLGRGMAEYRANNAQDSLSWLEQASASQNNNCRAAAQAFHALAAHQLGFSEVAHAQLQAAEEAAIGAILRDHWFDPEIAQIALEEARREILPSGTQQLVADAPWAYLCPADGVDPAGTHTDFHRAFSQLSFDESSWEVGRDASGPNGGLGYGDDTEVQWETPQKGNRYSAYLRHRFTTNGSFNNLVLRLRVDDGVIVYLDGLEVGRFNVAAGAPDGFELRASKLVTHLQEPDLRVIRLSASLKPGEHVLALSLHNVSPDSSDLWVRNISLHGTPAQ